MSYLSQSRNLTRASQPTWLHLASKRKWTPMTPTRGLSSHSLVTNKVTTKVTTKGNKGIFVPSKAWPAITQAGHECKKCIILEKNHFCLQHGHLGIKELVDKKSRGYFIPHKCWPAQTIKNEDCKQCAKFTPGYFCHHHTATPLFPHSLELTMVTPPSHPPLINRYPFSFMSSNRSPRFYEIAAFTTLATEFVTKTVSCSQ